MRKASLKLNNIRTLYLVVELFFGGKAGIVPELEKHEPININAILRALKVRAGKDFGDDFEAWLDWFFTAKNVATKEEKEILRMLLDFDEKWKVLISRIKDSN